MKATRVCNQCKRNFETSHPFKKFCSYKCKKEHDKDSQRKHPKPLERKHKICPNCKKQFYPDKIFLPHQKYCSEKCRAIKNSANYRIRHEDIVEAYNKAPEVIKRKLEATRSWQQRNPERHIKNCINWQKNNPEKVKEIRMKSYRLHYPQRKEWAYRYRKEGKGREIYLNEARKSRNLRRGLIKTGEVQLSVIDKKFIEKRDNRKCVYCGSSKFNFDHITPLINGGKDEINNVVLACAKCNSSKNKKDVFDWCRENHIRVPEIIRKLTNRML